MIYKSNEIEEKAILQTAARMCAAARTAPKAHGKDTIHTMALTGEDKDALASKMDEIGVRNMGEKSGAWYGRDANNIRMSQAVVLIGAENKSRGVPHCAYCGFADCEAARAAKANCALAYVDLGIALSSAVSIAAMDFIDCRIMFSAGKAAMEMGYTKEPVHWLGIPLSISGKNIFFDRNIFHD